MASFEQAIDKLLALEGGYVDHPLDLGGKTKYGISQRSYPHLDIANLTISDAKAIYKQDYWDKLNLDDQDQKKAETIFSTAVHCGVSTAKHLQSMVKDDLGEQDLFQLQWKLLCIMRYVAIVNRNKKQKVFLLGWLNRILQ